jgi:hypothetical protein
MPVSIQICRSQKRIDQAPTAKNGMRKTVKNHSGRPAKWLPMAHTASMPPTASHDQAKIVVAKSRQPGDCAGGKR